MKKGMGEGSQVDSVGSSGSFNIESDVVLDFADRERFLTENLLESQDVDLSLAFVTLRENAADRR